MGGPSASCGLNHLTPVKYCPIVAKGKACAGQCGLNHMTMQQDDIYCVNARRKDIPCTMKVCIFRHPEDNIPHLSELKEMLEESKLQEEE